MSINIADNMGYNGKKPLDNRLTYATLALMKAVTDANIYEGCEAYCAETDKYYKFLSTNTVDEDTGKWREREDSAGHIIEDNEGTALTQRDTMQFGEGFKAEDDDTNEKTVISPDVMQSGDMDDVVTPLPSVQSRYHRYSTEEQIVGEWIDGSTIYQKTVTISYPTVTTDYKAETALYTYTELGIPSTANVIYSEGFIVTGASINRSWNLRGVDDSQDIRVTVPCYTTHFTANNTTHKVILQTNVLALSEMNVYLTLRYTKTTD